MRTCLILDDYQQAALTLADWRRLSGQVAVSALSDHIADRDSLIARIDQAEILVIMRERTPFPAALLERLPRLELLVTSGMRNLAIDVAAAKARIAHDKFSKQRAHGRARPYSFKEDSHDA